MTTYKYRIKKLIKYSILKYKTETQKEEKEEEIQNIPNTKI